MANPTTNLSMTKPTVGGSTDTWGTTLNEEVVDIIDAVFASSGTNVSMADVSVDQLTVIAQGDLRLADTTGGQYVALQAHGTTTSYTLTMPAAVGSSGQALRASDGAGVLEWYTPADVGDITSVVAGEGMTGGGSSGAVTLNVIGTADKITVSADALTIASTYVGQTSIVTLGTIATGTWEGTTVAVDQGGTGATSLTDGGVLLGSGTGAITATSVLGDGEILIGDASGDPATLDVGSSTAITILGTVATGVWNGTAIANAYLANSTVSYGGVSLALGASDATPAFNLSSATAYTGDSSLVTVGTVASGTWNGSTVAVAYGGTGATTFTDGGVLLGSGTGAITATAVLGNGEILIGDASGDPVALDVGSSTAITILGTVATGVWNGTTVAVGYGGTGLASYTAGDILYASGTTTLAKLAKGSDTEVLTLASGVPTWAAPTVGDITSVVAGTGLSGGGTSGAVTLNVEAAQTQITSVGALAAGSIASGFTSISTSYTDAKVTSVVAGTLIDVSGATGDVTVNTDLSELSTSTSDGDGDYFAVVDAANAQKKLTKANISIAGFNTAVATSITGTGVVASGTWQGTAVGVAYGGTAISSYAAGDILYASGSTTLAKLAKGSDTEVLTLASGVPTWAAPTVGDITGVTAGTGLSGGGTSGTVTLNVEAAQTQITSVGTLTSLVATSADINAGTFDGIVGGTTPAAGSFSTLSASRQVFVNGTADENQLLVQGHSTQTSELVVFENSAGTNLLEFTNAGNMEMKAGSITMQNDKPLIMRDSGGVARDILNVSGSDVITIGNGSLATSITATLAVTGTSTLTGNVGIGGPAGGQALEVTQTTAGQLADLRNTHATAPDGLLVRFTGSHLEDRTAWFLQNRDDTNTKSTLWSDGGATFTGHIIGTSQALSTTLVVTGDVALGAASDGSRLYVYKAGDGQRPVKFETSNSGTALTFYNDTDGWAVESAGTMRFATGGTTVRMSISAAGAVAIPGTLAVTGTTTLTGNVGIGKSPDGSRQFSAQETVANESFNFAHSNALPSGISIDYTDSAINDTAHHFLNFADTGGTRGQWRSNGGIANYSANNVNLASDERLKDKHGLTASTWDATKAMEVWDFRYKEKPDGRMLVGVMAQRVQEVAPRCFAETSLEDGFHGLYEYDMQMHTLRTLQEAQSRIEALEAALAAM